MKTTPVCSIPVLTLLLLNLTQSPLPNATAAGESQSGLGLSPAVLEPAPDGRSLYVACATADQVLIYDVAEGRVTGSVATPGTPTGLAASRDGQRLYVTCAGPTSAVCVVDVAGRKIANRWAAGHTAMAPVLSPDGAFLYVCNRFNDDVSVIDLAAGREVARIEVEREPVAAAITPDGKFLLVANHLHDAAADAEHVAASVTVIDTAARKVVKEIRLPNGSGVLNDLCISPDGRYACVTHILARFRMPTTQLDRGWMNTNALSLIDLAQLELLNTVLLDNVDRGAANPWGVRWSPDGKWIAVALAGTHEVSVIDAPALLAKLAKLPKTPDPNQAPDYTAVSRSAGDVPNDLSFLVGISRRIRLEDRGPRALVILGTKVQVGAYFSDTLVSLDLAAERDRPSSRPLGPKVEPSVVRRGEFYFHDAGICFQGWQSCASCHPGDARVDALNWDLLNDGLGTPKNNKSLLLSHQTPPSMSQGVRETAEQAVRAGIRHILFTVQPEEVAVAMDEYLKALKPVPSPRLKDGALSEAAERGRQLFQDRKVGCADCHPTGLYTDLQGYNVGTRGELDRADAFDTPTLIEVWRTAPYLHDGSARTIREVLTTHNRNDQHGTTSHLTPQQIDDLAEYVLSL